MASPKPSPPSPLTLLRQAVFLTNRGKPQAALRVAQQARTAHEHHHGETGLAPYLVQLGCIYQTQKRVRDAESILRKAVAVDPNDSDALTALALVLKAKDPIHFLECLDLLRRARVVAVEREKKETDHEIRVIPASVEEVSQQLAALLTDVGVRLKIAGLPASAIQHYLEALDVCPKYAHALYNLAVAYADSSSPHKARECYEQCLQANPSHVEAWCNLGVLHRSDGNMDLAMNAYERALSHNPNFELAKSNLAVSLNEKGTALKEEDRKTAKMLYKKSLALQPSFADAHYNLGVLYAEDRKFQRALVEYNLAIQFNPRLTEAHNNLGVVHKELGNMEMALECYQRALQCDKQHHQTHNNIAVVHTLLGNVDAATEHLRLANSISPKYAEAHNNMGVLLRDQGDIDTAIWHYERCSELDPRTDMAAQNRLHALSYSEKWTKADVFHQHKIWGAAFQDRIDKEIVQAAKSGLVDGAIAAELLRRMKDPPRPDPEHPRGPGTGRPLRVGYISPDFFTHSVSYFAEALLTHYDPKGFQIYAYANVAQPDDKTARFCSIVDNKWRNIWGLTASAAAKLILEDRIDILVELAGHTANNRLDIMALRLAPVQVTWIGYPNTTGLPTVHYRVTDGTVDHPDTTQQFSEKLWRLPKVFLCYTPAREAPEEPGPPPCATSGGIITFGSFNVLSKTQSRTVKLWAAILKRVPDSRLLLKAKPFATKTAKQRMEVLFEEEGVSPDRLDLVPLIPSTRSHLEAYSNVDIALDPFPYAGTTTTCEALFMGVPVITLGVQPENGDHAHNVGVTLLTTIGHPELIAFTGQDYVEKAVALATDVDRLTDIRSRLREDMMSSPLGQAKPYLRDVEAMFCGMWTERGGRVVGPGTHVRDPDTHVGEGQCDDSFDGMREDSVGSTTPQCGTPSDSSLEQENYSQTESGDSVVLGGSK